MQRIELTGVPKTLLIPLYARALDYRAKRSILHDAKADELVRRIDFDFSTLGDVGPRRILAVRARQFDEWTREFLGRHPDAVVLNLGCGLDARFLRVRPPATALWFDLDFPDVVALRRRFYAEEPGYRMLGGSLTEPGALDAVPGGRPGIAVADGVLEYLAPPDVAALVHRIVDRVPVGEFVFDVMGSSAVQTVNARLTATGSGAMGWAVDDVGEVDRLDPRWRRTANRSLLATPYTPLGYRLAYLLLYPSRRFRRLFRLLRYEFGAPPGGATAP